MTAPRPWRLPAVVSLDQLQPLGVSVVDSAGESRAVVSILDHPGYLAKLYKKPGDDRAAARLDHLISLATADEIRALIRGTSWPVARIYDSSGPRSGCVIPIAPDRFKTRVGPGVTARERYLDIDQLAKPDESFVRRGLAVPTYDQRLSVCRGIVDVAATFERLNLVYSDWSYSNAFWSQQDYSAYVIDVDGCGVGSTKNIHQPNWNDPHTPIPEPADTFVERYRVALLVARCLTGERAHVDVITALETPSRYPQAIRPVTQTLLDMILAAERTHRPTVAALQVALSGGPYLRYASLRNPPPRPSITLPKAATRATRGGPPGGAASGRSRGAGTISTAGTMVPTRSWLLLLLSAASLASALALVLTARR